MTPRSITLAASLATLALFFSTAPAPGQTLGYSGIPALGQQVTFTTTGFPGGSYLVAASATPGPTPVPPIGTLALGLPFFFIVGPAASSPFFPALGPNGSASDVIVIPVNLALFNQTFWFQAAYFDPANPVGWTLTNGVNFTIGSVLTSPAFTSITPGSGGASGGTPVSILGMNFLPGPTTVTLGGQPLGNLQVPNAQTITGLTPPGIPGTSASLVITTPGGTVSAANVFSYLAEVPTILSISPDHARMGGGELITLSGTGLGPGTTIYLGGYALTPITQSAGQFLAFAPPVAQPGYVDAVAVSTQGLNLYLDAFRYTIILDTGTGAGGAFQPVSNTTLDTTANFGVFHFTSVDIPAGVTVSATGPNPLIIRSQGAVTIAGTLNLGGGNVGTGTAGPGGFVGGTQTSAAGQGPGGGFAPGGCNVCAGHGTSPFQFCGTASGGVYGAAAIQPLIGGSGGGYANNLLQGGGGGGAVSIVAGEDVLVSGSIAAPGGTGTYNSGQNLGAGAGSGGAIKLQSQGHVFVSGQASVAGGLNNGYACGGNGRWYVENWLGQASYDVTAQIPAGIY